MQGREEEMRKVTECMPNANFIGRHVKYRGQTIHIYLLEEWDHDNTDAYLTMKHDIGRKGYQSRLDDNLDGRK